MTVLGPGGITLEVPDIEEGSRFYTDAGLEPTQTDRGLVEFRCRGQDRVAITLFGGASRKRLHHVTLAADPAGLNEVRRLVPENGGMLVDPPAGFAASGVWLRDPHGLLIHLDDLPPERPLTCGETFQINAPGQLVRKDRSAMKAKGLIGAIVPLRLGHMLLFTPDVSRSIEFFERALGMGLADRAQDIVAFMCAKRSSDHHVVAFAKSPGIGFHHASFQVASPDEVGLGGRRLVSASGRGEWGFGRHTIGSNFFHYIQDPWGSWFEYYSDMDYISDHASWNPTNYALEDSLENWGPELPHDFVQNYECGEEFRAVA